MELTARNIESKAGPIDEWLDIYRERVFKISKDLGAYIEPKLCTYCDDLADDCACNYCQCGYCSYPYGELDY